MTPEQEIQRGADAERILNDPLYQETFATVKDSLIASLTRSALGDSETHHRLAIALQVHEQIQRALQQVMETGRMAEIQVQDRRKFKFFG